MTLDLDAAVLGPGIVGGAGTVWAGRVHGRARRPGLYINALVAQKPLEIADMVKHLVLLALELLQVASAFCAAGYAVGDEAFESEVDAV